MIFVRSLTKEEEKELRRMTRQEAGRVSQRAQMVLLSANRWTVPQIALVFTVSKATVRFWIRQFEAEGPEGLFDDERPGRPRKISSDVEQKLIEWLEDDPHQAHQSFLATFWTIPMLVVALATYLNVAVCCNTVRNALHRLKLSWGRPRLAMPQKTDPQKTYKQWKIVRAVMEAGPDAAILYADESRVQTLPLIRAMWHWIGQQIRVPTPGTNTTRAIFGALNIRMGEWIHMVRQRMRKEDFMAFLEHLLVVYLKACSAWSSKPPPS
jgi:transposase